jgi:hypothetical protein
MTAARATASALLRLTQAGEAMFETAGFNGAHPARQCQPRAAGADCGVNDRCRRVTAASWVGAPRGRRRVSPGKSGARSSAVRQPATTQSAAPSRSMGVMRSYRRSQWGPAGRGASPRPCVARSWAARVSSRAVSSSWAGQDTMLKTREAQHTPRWVCFRRDRSRDDCAHPDEPEESRRPAGAGVAAARNATRGGG